MIVSAHLAILVLKIVHIALLEVIFFFLLFLSRKLTSFILTNVPTDPVLSWTKFLSALEPWGGKGANRVISCLWEFGVCSWEGFRHPSVDQVRHTESQIRH